MTKKIFLFLFFSLFFLSFTCISLNRYNQGQLFYYDFGIFARIIWQLGHFQTPTINHLIFGKIFFLGDHFNPSLILISPLFWFTNDLRVLVLEQAAAITLSGYIVYLIARKVNLNTYAALVCSISYLIFAGTENPLVTDWHPEPTAALFLLIFFYLYLFKNKKILTLLIALIFIGFKESNAVSFFFLCIWLFIIKKEKRLQTTIIAVLSLLYLFIITRFIIPQFSHMSYLYSPQLPHNPLQLITNAFNSKEKINLLYQSFISFGFLPLLSGGLIPVIGELSLRLVPNNTIFNNLTLGQHYNVLLGVFLSLSTIFSIKYVSKWLSSSSVHRLLSSSRMRGSKLTIISEERLRNYTQLFIATVLLLTSLYTTRKITGSPINLVTNKLFWKQWHQPSTALMALNKVPKEGSIMSQNNLLAYTVNRKQDVYLLEEYYEKNKPQIILFDLSADQSINNFYGTDQKVVEKIKQRIANDNNYKRINSGNDTIYIYIRNK